ncbi:MAG: sigma-70 family RNA polymerase sigma factor [Burkholderiaceae bacterium]|nr:sigma-70 family RNA polymerase sigma factor [Burkholderiaceae bacterium]
MSTDTTAVAEVETLIRGDYLRLVRAVALMCGSAAVAEDATQEALTRAWQRAAAGERIRNLPGWVVVVAANEARSVVRRGAAEGRAAERLAARMVSPADLSVGVEMRDLREAVVALPDRQREVVVLHYFHGDPVADIALLLDISEGGVKNALFKARASLAQALGATKEVGL